MNQAELINQLQDAVRPALKRFQWITNRAWRQEEKEGWEKLLRVLYFAEMYYRIEEGQ